MLYMVSLSHSPQQCPGVAVEIRDRALLMASTMTEVLQSHGSYQGGWRQSQIRDRALLMASTMTEVLQSHGCSYQGGWVGKTSQTFMVLDAPDAHSADSALVDLGLAVWNTATIFPVITLEDAFGGLPS